MVLIPNICYCDVLLFGKRSFSGVNIKHDLNLEGQCLVLVGVLFFGRYFFFIVSFQVSKCVS